MSSPNNEGYANDDASLSDSSEWEYPYFQPLPTLFEEDEYTPLAPTPRLTLGDLLRPRSSPDTQSSSSDWADMQTLINGWGDAHAPLLDSPQADSSPYPSSSPVGFEYETAPTPHTPAGALSPPAYQALHNRLRALIPPAPTQHHALIPPAPTQPHALILPAPTRLQALLPTTPTRSRIQQDGPLLRFAAESQDDDNDGTLFRPVGLARDGQFYGVRWLERPVSPTPASAPRATSAAFHNPTRGNNGESIVPREAVVRAPVERGTIDFGEKACVVNRVEVRDAGNVEWAAGEVEGGNLTLDSGYDGDDDYTVPTTSPNRPPSATAGVDVATAPDAGYVQVHACHALCDGPTVGQLRLFNGAVPTFERELETDSFFGELLAAIRVLDIWGSVVDNDMWQLLVRGTMPRVHTLRVYVHDGALFPSNTIHLSPKTLVIFTSVQTPVHPAVKEWGIGAGVSRLVINASNLSDTGPWAYDWFPCVAPVHVDELVIIFDPYDFDYDNSDSHKASMAKFAKTIGHYFISQRKVTIVNLPNPHGGLSDESNKQWFMGYVVDQSYKDKSAVFFLREQAWGLPWQSVINNIRFLSGTEYAAEVGPDQFVVETCPALGEGEDIRAR